MSIELTGEQRQALQAEQGKPVDVVDPATSEHYVLVAREQYEQVRSLLEQPPASALSDLRTEMSSGASLIANISEGQPLRLKLRELPMPPEVSERVKNRCRKLGSWRPRYVQEIEEQAKLQYFFGGKYVAYLRTDEGGVIVASTGDPASEAFDRQLAALSPEERRRVTREPVDPWNGHTSLIL